MAETEFKYDVFISYSSANKDWVRKDLLSALEKAGLNVCIDFRDFQIGKPAIKNMRDSVIGSKHTLLILTEPYLESGWTEFENMLSQTLDPANRMGRIVPMLKERCKLPLEIGYLTYVNFYDPDDWNIAWKQLFTALGKPNAPIPGTPVKEPEPKTPESWFLAHPYGMPPNFTGRRAERNMLAGWLNSDRDHPLLIIRALGGFGKSALTWHWLTHDVDAKQFPAVVFWSFYEGDASFENFLKDTLKYLGVPNAEQLNPRQQTEILLNLLQQPGLLLILDGFERVLRAYSNMGAAYQGDELQIDRDDSQDKGRDCVNIFADAFLQGIGAFGFMMRSKVLMTTRLTPRAVERYGQFLQGVREEELKEMKKEDAVAFFQAQGIRGTHAEIETACEPYGYHPLSLRILAGLIINDRNAPGDISAAKTLEITGDIIQNKQHVLATAFSTLSPSQKSLLGRVACFRAPTSYDALKTIQGSGQGNNFLDDSLKALESRGLVHWDRKANKYDLHPIVRRFAYDRLTASDRTAAHTRLVNYFDAIPKLEKVDKLEDLAPVIELYHHMVRAGRLDEAMDLFYNRLHSAMYYQFGAYQIYAELLRALFLDGESKPPRLKREDAQAYTLNALASAYSLSGQLRRAVPLWKQQQAIREKQGEKKGLAIGLGAVASVALLPIGALREAERNLRRAMELCREVGNSLEEASDHWNLARVFIQCGLWTDAEQELSTSFEMAVQEKSIQLQGIIWATHALRFLLMAREAVGSNQSQIENLKSSIESAQRALELADETAKTIYPHPVNYILSYWLLGAAYRENGNLDESDKNLSKAISICRQINNVMYEADILIDFARLRYAQGDFKDAREKASEALMITERSGYVLQGADVNLFLAQYALEQEKDNAKAKVYAESALKLAHCDDGPPYYYKVAYDEAERFLENLK